MACSKRPGPGTVCRPGEDGETCGVKTAQEERGVTGCRARGVSWFLGSTARQSASPWRAADDILAMPSQDPEAASQKNGISNINDGWGRGVILF